MKIVYICDIAEDIDDVIAVEWLYRNNYLKYVVLDGKSIDVKRMNYLLDLGVEFKFEILDNEKIIFCGGSYTKIAEYVKNNKIDFLIGNGGFCGCNIVEDPLEKFSKLIEVPTFNFNLDINAIKICLNSENIKNLIFVSKNVCHDKLNTFENLHIDEFLKSYNLRASKCLHDLLMVKEGIKILKFETTLCDYENVDLYSVKSEFNKYTKWGSLLNKNSKIKISKKLNVK